MTCCAPYAAPLGKAASMELAAKMVVRVEMRQGDTRFRHAGREQRARMATARSVREPAAVTLANISVAVSDASTTASTAVSPLWLERALDLWRQHGVVVFPALVPSTEVERLKTYLFAMRRDGGRGARDRSASIRSPLHREMKGMAVVRSSAA